MTLLKEIQSVIKDYAPFGAPYDVSDHFDDPRVYFENTEGEIGFVNGKYWPSYGGTLSNGYATIKEAMDFIKKLMLEDGEWNKSRSQ